MDTSKIIKGVVNSGRYTVTAPIVKEDYGLYLQIEGVELPQTYEVDFSNSEHSGTSVTMIGNSDGVLIPHQFIDTGKDIFAFLYHVGEDFGRTVYKFRIPNKVRPDRTNEQPTPEEQSTIDQAISALNTAVEQTAQDVIDADASAQNASADAERAEEARTDAQNYATQAQTSANNASASASQASTSATASAQSASQSAQIKADVEDLADDAQGYAQASAQSASASANSASQAQGYAQSASASAQSASGYASQAQSSANTASSKATEASTSAQTASTKATESAQSASQALTYKNDAESAKTASQTAQGLAESARDTAVSAKTDAESARDDAVQAKEDAESAVASISGALAEKAPVITDTASGAIASFSDGADDLPLKSLIVDINPIQDLHGQDSPWPAGGGKNLFNPDTVVVGYINDTTGELNETSVGVNSRASEYIAVDGGTSYFFANSAPSGRWGAWYDENKGYISSCNGVGVKTAPSAAKYVRITVSHQNNNPDYADNVMVAKSTAEIPWSPYENLCPISGWTEVDVEQSGVNLFDGNSFVSGRYDNADFSISSASDTRSAKIYLKAGSYTLSANGTSSINRRILNGAMSSAIRNLPMSFTLSADGWFGFSTTDLTGDFKLELGSTATPYSPYTGRSITIPLGQTVYGGKLDVLSGVLTVDRAMVDLWTLNWSRYTPTETNIPVFYTRIEGMNISAINTALCSMFKAINWEALTNRTDKTVCPHPSLNFIYVADSDYENATEFTGAVSGQGYCYKLATPITIQLTPNQVNSLLGVNNLWADSGDTEVEYRADTKLFIERLTAPDSADMIADANITSGKYFMVGNSLYKATANIANGSAIVVGTNCIRKSLSEALNEINA